MAEEMVKKASSPTSSPRDEEELMKKGGFASARGSAILATLTEGISKLSGPQ